MGDIDSTNFTESTVLEFKAAVESASFLAIDLEMTGISFPGSKEGGSDTIPFRYHKIRQVAAKFGIIQIGVAVFGEPAEAGSPVPSKVFNFYVFPRPVTEGSTVNSIPLITLCSASTNFNRSHGMDFGRWIDKGITYVNSDTEEKLKDLLLLAEEGEASKKAWDRLLGGFTGVEDSVTKSEEFQAQLARVDGEIAEFVKNAALTSYKVPFIHGGQKWLKSILHAMRDKYPTLRLVEEVSGGGSSRVLSKKSPTELFNEYVGFTRIWNVLTGSGKPIVFHNGFLDLMFCYNAFERELPESLAEFKQDVAGMFPGGLFDTRLIALESGLSFGNSAALETLADLMAGDFEWDITESGKYNSAAMDTSAAFHEAGYDALLTGKVFLGLKRRLGKKDVVEWKDHLCISRCAWVLSINSAETDRLLLDCGPNKSRVVRALVDLSHNCSTRDILSAFEDVKNTQQACTVNIQWIDDTSGLLVVTWGHNGDKPTEPASVSLNAKLIDLMKSATSLGPNAKLLTTHEFIKVQMEGIGSVDPLLSKRFRL